MFCWAVHFQSQYCRRNGYTCMGGNAVPYRQAVCWQLIVYTFVIVVHHNGVNILWARMG